MEEIAAVAGGDASAGGRAFGFLTSVDSPAHGVFGGYLLVDQWGRPLEFHCTAPVKVSRAQQILYGASLAPHLHGRNIGAALLAEAGIVPQVVFTDVAAMLHVRGHTPVPVLLVGGPPPAGDEPPAGAIVAGGAMVSAAPGDTDRLEAARSAVGALAAAVALDEPFERIRAAIEEAQRH